MTARLLTPFLLVTLGLAASTAAAQSALPPGLIRTDTTARPVFGTATTPSVRPLALTPDAVRRGELAWTLTFTEPNRPGSALAGGIAPAPDGGVCTLTIETLGGAASGPVVTRYGADGTEQWAHPVFAWAGGYNAQLREVTADGGACVAAVAFGAGTPLRLEVARVDGGGVAWTHHVEAPSPDWIPGRAFVRPDGVGGVWIGTGKDEYPVGPALLTRVDGMGTETVRVLRAPSNTRSASGVRALTVLPDGRAVAAGDADLLFIVDLTGGVSATPADPDFTPTAVVPDPEDETKVFVMGQGEQEEVEVRQIGLDGTTAWTRVLGDAFWPPYRRSPYAFAARDGVVVATWEDAQEEYVAQLNGADGSLLWQRFLDTGAGGGNPEGVVVDDHGVVVWLDGFGSHGPNSDLIAFAPDGELRWVRTADSPRTLGSTLQRALVPCGAEAVCQFGTDGDFSGEAATAVLLAVGPDAQNEWVRFRQGEPAPIYEFSDSAPAPDGGVYLYGRTRTESGGYDVLVVRVSPSGEVLWSTAVDGGGTSEEQVDDGIDAAPDGGVVVAATTTTADGVVRPLAARLHPDGTGAWVTLLEPEGAFMPAAGVVAEGDGGATVSAGFYDGQWFAPLLSRLGSDGAEVWTTPVSVTAHAIPRGLLRTAGGYALAAQLYPTPETTTLRLDYFDVDGAATSSTELTEAGSCQIYPWAVELNFEAGSDADGVAYMGFSPSRGPSACARPAVVRVAPEGAVRVTQVGPSSPTEILEFRGLDVRPDGAVAVSYQHGGEGGLAWVRSDGTVAWDDAAAVTANLTSVLAGSSERVFTAGTVPEAGLVGLGPRAYSYAPGAGAQTVELPLLDGLPTEASETALGPEEAGYVILNTRAFGVVAGGLSRIDGAVSTDATPTAAPSAQALQVIGSNPVHAGGALRLRGGGLGTGEPATLTLYDVLGRRVATWPDAETEEVVLPVPDVPTGVYVLRVAADEKVETVPLTIVR